MEKIKYTEGRRRYIPGVIFSSLFKITEIELCSNASHKGYPIPIKRNLEELIYNEEQRLKWRLEEYNEDRYEDNEGWALCYIVQEIPMYVPTQPGKYIQERLYRHGALLGGIYCDMWAKDKENGICEWFACDGEDETIAKEFVRLRKCDKGEIVQVVMDDCLTLGIIVDYCDNGCYDMWVWREQQGCARVCVPSSRILYGIYIEHEACLCDDEIKDKLKNKLNEK